MLGFPNAKINLGLNIIAKRNDGFHDIESVFYPIKWTEALEIIPSDTFEFTTSGLQIPGNSSSNLIIKAYDILKKYGYIKDKEVKIHLHKVLPMGAGIGGGSADAAFALKMLNEIFELNLNNKTLENFAAELGSDCPFFIENKVKFCYGRGTEFENISIDLNGKYLALINPEIHISTAEAYSVMTPKIPNKSIKEILLAPISTWKNELFNDFELGLAQKYPKISQIKNQLYASGALYASMTGSGSTIYGIFENEIKDLDLEFKDCTCWSGKA